MTMIEQMVSTAIGVLAGTLLAPFIREKWKDIRKWNEARKTRRRVRKHDKQIRRELLKAGLPKDEL